MYSFSGLLLRYGGDPESLRPYPWRDPQRRDRPSVLREEDTSMSGCPGSTQPGSKAWTPWPRQPPPPPQTCNTLLAFELPTGPPSSSTTSTTSTPHPVCRCHGNLLFPLKSGMPHSTRFAQKPSSLIIHKACQFGTFCINKHSLASQAARRKDMKLETHWGDAGGSRRRRIWHDCPTSVLPGTWLSAMTPTLPTSTAPRPSN